MTKPPLRSPATWVALTAALALLAAVAAASIRFWRDTGHTDISVNGWIAFGLGALLTFGVGGGLMSLVFFSSRHGYDDQDRDDH